MRRAWFALFAFSLSSAAWGGWEADRRGQRRAEVDQLVQQIARGENVSGAAARITYLDEGDYAASQLARTLQDSLEPSVRRDVVFALAQLKSRAAESQLISLTRDEDSAVRMAAARGLGTLRSRAVDALSPLLGDGSLGVRREAATALGLSGERRVGKLLIDAAQREAEPEVRAAMLSAVGPSGDRAQCPLLLAFLRHSSESARLAAAQSLCRLQDPRGVAFLRERLAQSEPLAQRRHVVTLLEGVPLKTSGPLLRALRSDSDALLAATSARLLHQAGEPRMLEWLVVTASAQSGEAKRAYEDQLELLHLTDAQRAQILARSSEVAR